MPQSDPQNAPNAEPRRLIVPVLIALFAVGAVLLIVTSVSGAKTSRRRLAPLLVRVDQLHHVAADHAEAQKQLDDVQKSIGDPDKVVGAGAASNRAAEAIYRVAASSGVKVDRVQPVIGAPVPKGPYVTAGVRASLNCKIQNLGRFLDALAKDASVSGLTQLTIEGDPKKPGQLTVTIVAMTLARQGDKS